MRCPICPDRPLEALTLESGLSSHHCAGCDGIFLLSSDYRDWVAGQSGPTPERDDPEPEALVAEPARAKSCPYCQHLLLRYRVSHQTPFTVDHCGHCNSVWLDAGEWASLKRRNLHDDIHRMFTEPWQRNVRKAIHRANLDASYAAKFGAAEYAEIQRIKAWMDAHPHVQALRAYLTAEDPYRLD
jgi:Zn-finger nucleic acid-binding protein